MTLGLGTAAVPRSLPFSGPGVKNIPANTGDSSSIPELEDSLEAEKATHSSILAWRIPMDRGAWRATVHRVAKSQTRLSD